MHYIDIQLEYEIEFLFMAASIFSITTMIIGAAIINRLKKH